MIDSPELSPREAARRRRAALLFPVDGLCDPTTSSGSRPTDRAADGVSPVPASIPIASEQDRVILALAEVAPEHLSFAHTSQRSNVPIDKVRQIARRLKEQGLAVFGRGLWTEDGEMYGSGYALTTEGVIAAQGIEAGTAETQRGSVNESPTRRDALGS